MEYLKTHGKEEYGPSIVSAYGMDFMERQVNAGNPFFLYYPMILTHCPFSLTPSSSDWLKRDSIALTYKGEAPFFKDMVSYTDYIIGQIVATVEKLGIEENTLILFTGDNGTDVPIVSELGERQVAGAKGQSTDAGTRVPLIAYWPNTIKTNGKHRRSNRFLRYVAYYL